MVPVFEEIDTIDGFLINGMTIEKWSKLSDSEQKKIRQKMSSTKQQFEQPKEEHPKSNFLKGEQQNEMGN